MPNQRKFSRLAAPLLGLLLASALGACGGDGQPAAELASVTSSELTGTFATPDGSGNEASTLGDGDHIESANSAGNNPSVGLTRDAIDFGTLALESSNATLEYITITNNSTTPLTLPSYGAAQIKGAGATGNHFAYDFLGSEPACPMYGDDQLAGLAPGASCVLGFQVSATTPGPETVVWNVAASSPFSITFTVNVTP